MIHKTNHIQTIKENSETTKKSYLDEPPVLDVEIYGDVTVRIYKTHVRLTKCDWLKYKKQMISAWNKGDKKHATGNTEEGSDEK
jgi:hypothetical protein